jgi:PAS domain S-box-containing protein
LKESEQRWVTTLASIGDAVIATDMEGRIMFMNGVAEELTGWTLIEASQKPVKQIFNIVNEQTRKEVEDPVAKVLERGVVCGLANHTVLVRKDKTEVAIDDSGAPIIDKDGKITGVVLIFRDITERKKAEDDRAKAQVKLEENAILLEEYANQMEDLAEQRAQQLKDAERLAAIGQTAGMVGHDIRNPLQAITGDLYLLGEELKTMPKSEGRKAMEESIEAIDENIVYINKIVSDLQDYTRPLKPNIEAVNLKDLINSTLIVTNIPENIHAEVNAKANLILKVDAAYLRRVLTNLIVNAVQAMPKGGKLTINVVSKKDRAIVSVEDTGVGVPEEVKPNLFKPLFTTKSKGQGLGLAVVKRFVEGLNGKVSFESEEGTGTKFIIDLPLSNKEACS